ncbi:MAG: thioredoxin family protein [Desulfovibrionaceae bacterium]|nr:thioredoxin family protein [Desulfovibrionaceae bacterium]
MLLCLGPSAQAYAKSVPVKLFFAQDDNAITCALKFQIPEGFHAYSHEIGDAGRPTVLDLTVDNKAVESIFYPKGAAQRDQYAPDTSVFVYEGETYLFASLTQDTLGKDYIAQLSLLLCSKRNCIPINQEINGHIPQKLPAAREQPWYPLKQQVLAQNAQNNLAENPILQSILPEITPAKEAPLPPPDNFAIRLSPQYADNSFEIASLQYALLIGLLAGLILNFMPCVLPVLTFKITGMLLIGHKNKHTRIRLFREHNLAFAIGIISFFTILAFVLGGLDLIWGQLFQSQTLLLALIIAIFLMALSLLGIFSLPVIDLKVSQNSKNPILQSFFTGFLTTFLATPCSGPLLGGVLGWAFTQPLYILMLVFWSVGFGMALPYIIFTIWPKTVLLLPKPGAWMNVLEHVAGFFLLGTTIYLLSILPENKYILVLSVLLIVSVSAWLWGNFCGPEVPKIRRHAIAAIGLVLLILACNWVLQPADAPLAWQKFTPETFVNKLGKKMILVEFTADWCPNCKFVERTVLTDNTLNDLRDRADVELVRADLTQANAGATYLLTELGSHSIPLTAIFPKGTNSNTPIVLRDVYDKNQLKKSFELAIDKSR